MSNIFVEGAQPRQMLTGLAQPMYSDSVDDNATLVEEFGMSAEAKGNPH